MNKYKCASNADTMENRRKKEIRACVMNHLRPQIKTIHLLTLAITAQDLKIQTHYGGSIQNGSVDRRKTVLGSRGGR